MELTLFRKKALPTATIGELHVNGVFECYTLEDVVRDLEHGVPKVYGKTAIPAGTYKVTLTESNRFKRVLPLLNSVPFFDGIRIHPGNTSADTDGCILVGTTAGSTDFIGSSRVAFEKLFAKLQAAQSITITVHNI